MLLEPIAAFPAVDVSRILCEHNAEKLQLPATLVTPDLSPGNNKLGAIANWSIPAMLSCPGKSTLCEELCYADRGYYYTSSVRDKLYANWAVARSSVFVPWMIRCIQHYDARVVRVHVAGDFFSADYATAWGEIFSACPDVRFYYYTRSWRVPSVRLALEAARQPNVRVWYSCDAETGKPVGLGRSPIRLAYMMTAGEDRPAFDVDLVFRDQSYRPGERLKRIAGRRVCPAEQHESQHARCDSCRICYDDERQHLLRRTQDTTPARRTALPVLRETLA